MIEGVKPAPSIRVRGLTVPARADGYALDAGVFEIRIFPAEDEDGSKAWICGIGLLDTRGHSRGSVQATRGATPEEALSAALDHYDALRVLCSLFAFPINDPCPAPLPFEPPDHT